MTYRGLHYWVTRKLGKANHCSVDITHKSTRYHWSNVSGEYKQDLNDWQQLCPSCHKKIDMVQHRRTHCKKGHEYTPENTRWNTRVTSWRVCRQCNIEYAKQYYKKGLTA